MADMKAALLASWIAVLSLSLLNAIGCRIDTHKSNGNDDVKIATPFGGMSVKTNDAMVQEGIGLAVYPGSTLVKKNKDDGAADVNMSFGSFHLRVKAATYHSVDDPDKVLAFYRNDMARYGTVILCRHNQPIGQPDHTADGLTCDQDKSSARFQVDDEKSSRELKAGSKQRQHIVSVDSDGPGTKIGLVALELPGHFGNSSDDKQ